MNKKSLKASISIILIIIIFLLSITILYLSYLSQYKGELIEYSIDSRQAKYISESYRDYYCREIEKNQEVDNISKKSLFPDLDYESYESINKIDMIWKGKQIEFPKYEVKVQSIYEDINYYSYGYVEIYNSIFSLGYPQITYNNIPKTFLEDFNIFINKFKLAMDEEFVELNNSIINNFPTGYMISRIDSYDEDNILETIRYPKRTNFKLTGRNIIGYNPNNSFDQYKNIYFGIWINEGELILNKDFIFNGIFISNNGYITNSDKYDFIVEGIFIEIGQSGSYPNGEFIYNPSYINVYINNKDWAKNFKINKRINLPR